MSADGFVEMSIVMIAIAIFQTAIIPLSDAYAMDTVRAGQGDYGRMRLWGSIAFMVATLAGGAALEVMSSGLVPQAMDVAFLVCGLTAIFLPELNQGETTSKTAMPPITGSAHSIGLLAWARHWGDDDRVFLGHRRDR